MRLFLGTLELVDYIKGKIPKKYQYPFEKKMMFRVFAQSRGKYFAERAFI